MDDLKYAPIQDVGQNNAVLAQLTEKQLADKQRTHKVQFEQFVQSQTSEYFYILFNSANHPQLPQQYYALDTEQQYIGLLQELMDGYNEQSIPVMPYLIEINLDNIAQNPFINWLFSTTQTRSSFFALTSDYDIKTVAEHWNSLALVYSSQQQVVILRLFDGRIGKTFLSQISTSEQQQLMGPCQNYWFVDESGEAQVIHNESEQYKLQIAPWFHLSQQHEEMLSGEENKTLRYNLTLYLWENHPQALSQYPLEMVDQLIKQGLKKSQMLGFTQTENLYICTALFFCYSPILYRHNAVQTLWSKKASEQQHLKNISDQLTTEQWQHIAQPASMADWMDLPESDLQIE